MARQTALVPPVSFRLLLNSLLALTIGSTLPGLSAMASAGASSDGNGVSGAISQAAPHTIQGVMSGPPIIENILGEASFVPYEMEKLSHADVWFADYDWFREHGIDVPPEGINSPEFKKQMLDAMAWQTRGADDRPEDFTGEKKISFADFYGGYGMSVNFGSGRAGANGLLQAKGVKTPLAKSRDPFHSNGAVQSIEAVDEAIWSQILNSEMRFGSNRIVAIILTGTYGKMKSGQLFPRALIIREMALRPAHFMLNASRAAGEDRERVGSVLHNLLKSLPYPKTGQPARSADAIRAGMLQLLKNEATVQAEYYAKRMYFGSNSPSNLEISGRRLDLGDHSANASYTNIYRIEDESPFGETEEFHRLFQDFAHSMKKTLPQELASAVLADTEIAIQFDLSFRAQQEVEMVRLSGAPNELVDAMTKEKSLTGLGKILVDISKSGNGAKVFMEPAGYKSSSRYDINQLLIELSKISDVGNAELINMTVSRFISDNSLLKDRLVKAYVGFNQALAEQARRAGLSDQALATYKKEAAKIRNRSRNNLIRGDRRWKELWTETDKGINGRDAGHVEKYIESQANSAIFNFKDASPFQVVLKQEKRDSGNLVLRRIFDAKTGSYGSVVRVQVGSGFGYFNGRRLTKTELEKSALDYVDARGVQQSASAEVRNGFVEFTLPNLTSVNLSGVALRTNSAADALAERRSDKDSGARSDMRAETKASSTRARVGGRVSPVSCEALFAL